MLDLGVHGISGMSWLQDFGAYLVIGGPAERDGQAFGLWLWSGEAEGVCPAIFDERACIVRDHGDRADGRCARYLVLDPAALRVDD